MNETVSPLRAAIQAAGRKALPYIIGVVAGAMGYAEGDQQLLQKCVAGVTAEQAQ